MDDVSHPIRSHLIAASAILSVASCASNAYGPEADDRLAAAVTDNSTVVASDTVQSCGDLVEGLGRARNAERPEGDRLRSYMQLYHDLEAGSRPTRSSSIGSPGWSTAVATISRPPTPPAPSRIAARR